MSIKAHPGAAERCEQADIHPVVAAVRTFSREVLAPRAVQHDDAGVPAHVIVSFADVGLLNHVAPHRYGGAHLDRAADRRVHEHLAYGCVNTWLIWAQHASVVRRVTRSLDVEPMPGSWAERVLRGEILAGVAARVLDELSSEQEAIDVVATWTPRVGTIRETAYGLAEEAKESGEPDHRVDDRLTAKAAANEALGTLSQALLLTRGGRGLTGGDTAQLHCRSAMFLSIQGQTPAVRRRQLARIAAAGS